jgi:hypothetical protein
MEIEMKRKGNDSRFTKVDKGLFAVESGEWRVDSE